MATYGSVSEASAAYNDIIPASELSALLRSFGFTGAVNITATDGSNTQSLTAGEVGLVNNSQSVIDGLNTAAGDRNSAGAPNSGIGDKAVYINAPASAPGSYVIAADAAFLELQGTTTVVGSTASTFVVDASNNASDVSATASSADNSYSWLIGGSGNTTMTGSSSSTGSVLMNAGSGPTTMDGSAGSATMYGGGATTMYAGSHAGQTLLDFTANSNDSMQAGSGGFNQLAVTSGSNTLDDRFGKGVDSVTGVNSADSLYAGSGNDTLFGSANGTFMQIKEGNSSIVSTGNDTIVAYGGGNDTIDAGSDAGEFDQVTFVGHTAAEIQGLVSAAQAITGDQNNATITFTNATSTDQSVQTVTFKNVTHINFKDG